MLVMEVMHETDFGIVSNIILLSKIKNINSVIQEAKKIEELGYKFSSECYVAVYIMAKERLYLSEQSWPLDSPLLFIRFKTKDNKWHEWVNKKLKKQLQIELNIEAD